MSPSWSHLCRVNPTLLLFTSKHSFEEREQASRFLGLLSLLWHLILPVFTQKTDELVVTCLEIYALMGSVLAFVRFVIVSLVAHTVIV